MSTSDDIAAAIDAVAATLVTDGEQVEGKLTLLKIRFVLGTTCVAIVTDRRLVLQPLGYANRPKGQAISVQRDQIARFAITGFGSDWREAVITSDSMGGFTLRLQTIDGRKLKLGVGYGEQGSRPG